jgi:hypothetical protein
LQKEKITTGLEHRDEILGMMLASIEELEWIVACIRIYIERISELRRRLIDWRRIVERDG